MHGKGQRTLSKLDSEVTKVPSVRFLGSIDFFWCKMFPEIVSSRSKFKEIIKGDTFSLGIFKLKISLCFRYCLLA